MIAGCRLNSITLMLPAGCSSPATLMLPAGRSSPTMVLRRWSGQAGLTRPSARNAVLRLAPETASRSSSAAAVYTKGARHRGGLRRAGGCLGVARPQPKVKFTPPALMLMLEAVAPWLTPLQANRVRPSTQHAYTDALLNLLGEIGRRALPTWTALEWDSCLPDVISRLRAQGSGVEQASRMVTALLWAMPQLGRPLQTVLPSTSAALAGWRRLVPTCSRPPVPRMVMWGIAVAMLGFGDALGALAVVTLFETYLRPSELLALLGFQILVPILGSPTASHVGVCIRASELEVLSKTGDFDNTVLLDLDRHKWLGRLLVIRREICGKSGRVFPMELDQLRQSFLRGAAAAGVIGLSPTLYGLRHGGASHDRAANERDLLAVQGRGHWRSTGTLRRYEKSGRLLIELDRLPSAVLLRLQRLEKQGPDSFERRCARFLRSTAASGSSSTSSPALVGCRMR